jgi:hypothetical protein
MCLLLFIRSERVEAFNPELQPAGSAGQVRPAGKREHLRGIWQRAGSAHLLANTGRRRPLHLSVYPCGQGQS